MDMMTSQIDFFKYIFRVIIVSSITGFLLVIVVDKFWGTVLEFLSKDQAPVSAVIERVELSAKKKYDGSRQLTSVYYSLGLECVYSFAGKTYVFIEGHSTDKDGQAFSTLMPLIELTQKLSPRQPITLYGKSYFDQNEKELISNQELLKGVKGTRELTISKKSPELVIRNSSKKARAILVPIFCLVLFLGLAFYFVYLPFKKSTPTQATILLLIVSLCGYGAIVFTSKWFWHGGSNTKIYDPNKPEDPESLTIYKGMVPSELSPK